MRNRDDQTRQEDQSTEPTYDGKRLQIDEINTGTPAAGTGRIRRALRNLSLFFAGMYTGESCAGTPHSERKKNSKPAKPSRKSED